MGKERIAVRVPCGWDVTGSVALFLVNLEKMNGEAVCPFEFHIGLKQNYKPADYARNVCVKEFLEHESLSRLWFVDSDVLPKTRECIRLLLSDDDIVGGAYDIWGQDRKDGPVRPTATTYIEAPQGGWYPAKVPDDGFYNIDAIGTGMMVIKRRVLADERLWKNGTKGAVFQNIYGDMGNIIISEDLDFCKRAKALGYTVVAHGAAKVGHIKTVNVADIVDYAREESAKNGSSPSLSVHAA